MKIIKALLWAASFCLFIYLGASFVEASFNIVDWSKGLRSLVAVFGMGMSIVIFFSELVKY